MTPKVRGSEKEIHRSRKISIQFVHVVGFSNGCAELALKKPPPFVPSSLMTSCDDRHRAEGQHRSQIAAPLLGIGIDSAETVYHPLRPKVVRRSERPGHVVTEWAVHNRQRENDCVDEYDAGPGGRHQNFSGSTRATIKKMVSAMERISQTMLAALISRRSQLLGPVYD
jgi:hypothetical protein